MDQQVDREFHQRGLRGETIQDVKTNPMCQMMKSDNRAKVGLLQSLEIYSTKWAHVTMDLIIELLESNGFTSIVVFANKLTKMVHLVWCKKKVTTMEYAHIFVDNVFWLHRLAKMVISDRDPHFTGKFWHVVFDSFSTDLWFSTVFHP